MTERVQVGGLQVAKVLYDFVNDEALPGTGVDAAAFWAGADKIIARPGAEEPRAARQARRSPGHSIDTWHRDRAGQPHDRRRLQGVPAGDRVPRCPTPAEPFQITTANVDSEIATTAGPQLVVPVLNARFALNASNARWGSLYDALYGTDAISEDDGAEKGTGYNKVRGDKVIAWARDFLDDGRPARDGIARRLHHLRRSTAPSCAVTLADGTVTGLAQPEKLVGYLGDKAAPTSRAAAQQRPAHRDPDRRRHPRSAAPTPPASRTSCSNPRSPRSWTSRTPSPPSTPTTRCIGYRNWLGLNRGDLSEEVSKGGKTFTRTLNADRVYTALDGSELDAARTFAAVRAQRRSPHDQPRDPRRRRQRGARGHPRRSGHQRCAPVHGLYGDDDHGPLINSRTGSIYIVKPKHARPRRSRVHRPNCSAASRRSSACPPTRSRSASWTRSAAPRSTSRPASRKPQRARRVHQHRLPRPHRRRDPHLHGGRRRWCARPR